MIGNRGIGVARDDAGEIDGVAVDDCGAHARSGFDTCNVHNEKLLAAAVPAILLGAAEW